jgi:uncharacterized protein YjiS (DUF1127 family)
MLRTPAASLRKIDLLPAVQRTMSAYLGSAAASIGIFIERDRQRRALAELDEHLLRDLGLNRSVVARELHKHFWQP